MEEEYWQYISFGKHKGKLWSDVPEDYLQWCYQNFSKGSAKKAVSTELRRRRDAKHVKATWQPPAVPNMSQEERDRQFAEVVDVSQGNVFNTERWQNELDAAFDRRMSLEAD